jgi:hypothetical protein
VRAKTLKNYCGFLFVLMIFLLTVLACNRSESLGGKVYDEDGNPLSDAKTLIVMDESKFEIKTGNDGSYRVISISTPFRIKTKITISKEGYQTFEQTFNSQSEHGNERIIVLKKN